MDYSNSPQARQQRVSMPETQKLSILETSAHVMHIMLFITVFHRVIRVYQEQEKKELLKNKRKHTYFSEKKSMPYN